MDPWNHDTILISNIFFAKTRTKKFTSFNKEGSFYSDGVFSSQTLGCVRGEKKRETEMKKGDENEIRRERAHVYLGRKRV